MKHYKCEHCGKPAAANIGGLYAHGKYFCTNSCWNMAHNAPTFDPRKLRPEAYSEQNKNK